MRWLLLGFLLLAPAVAEAQVSAQSGTDINSVCAFTHGYPNLTGDTGCAGITRAWNSGAVDQKNMRLIIFGCGHNDCYGNEVYAFNAALSTPTIEMLKAPTYSTHPGGCPSTAIGGGPNSRHTNDGAAYIEHTHELFIISGAGSTTGCALSDAWTFNLSTLAWSQISSPPSAGGIYDTNAAYDPVGKQVWTVTNGTLSTYDPTARTFTTRATGVALGSFEATMVFEPRLRRLYSIGSGVGGIQVRNANTSTGSYSAVSFTTSGDASMESVTGPGCGYDDANQRITCWRGGLTFYHLNTITGAWTAQTLTGTSFSNANIRGVYKRFGYVRKLDAFLLCNETAEDCAIVRFNTARPSFATRCAQPGVIRCEGMDSQAAVSPFLHTSGGAASDPTRHAADTTFFASGTASLRFRVDVGTGADCCGSYRIDASPGTEPNGVGPYPYRFVAGDTWEWSYRVYVQCEGFYTDCNSAGFGTTRRDLPTTGGSGGRKFSNFGSGTYVGGPGSGDGDSSCTDLEIVVQDTDQFGFWQGYSHCPPTDNFSVDIGGGNFNLQPGDDTVIPGTSTPGCTYNGTRAHCITIEPGEWWAHRVRVTLGNYNSPNSRVQVWVAREGQPWREVIDMQNWELNSPNLTTDLYGKLWLTIYHTGQDPLAAPGFAVWYDDVIFKCISGPTCVGSGTDGQGILAPTAANTEGGGSPPSAPAAPAGLTISRMVR